MENALLVGLSRQVALRRELDVIANNIANINTTGFKGESMMFEQYLDPTARHEYFPGNDRRIAFVMDRATLQDFTQGPLQRTEAPLDVAIDGPGFFAVQTQNGERFTRAGNFHLNPQGQLVNNNGHLVLGQGGPIVFEPTDTNIAIAADGTISATNGAGQVGDRGKLRMVTFANPPQLTQQGDGLWSAGNGLTPQVAPVTTRAVQGALEKSNVQAVKEMNRMLEVTRAYTTINNMQSRTDELRRKAIEKLAEV
ncbi:MAG: flagellar basal-body rod protein FlgF [Xanthobacteraceae bacterium]|nr:flagellar basal-body rod protein FlgF [Xanthobacteraceae bacterium]MCW5679175.1 flagellar basal-body rod protein FlgF [Xanthobacteraceae bacterium]